MSAHSNILGGSNAARLLACPASYQEQLKVPFADIESSYAAEGTALHQAIAHCVEHKVAPSTLVGEVFYEHEITEERAELLTRALATLNELLCRYGDAKRFKIIGIEQTLPLPGIPGAFGSCDLILSDQSTVIVIDWKFGGGVKVAAVYSDEDGDTLNPQLAFYAVAARARHRRRFKGKRIVVAIIQPRLEQPLAAAETDDAELDAFQSSFQNAVVEALGRDAHRERGEWCRFASCKSTCILWNGPVFDLALIDPVKAALKASVNPQGYGGFLSHALTLAAIAEEWASEIRKQTHVFLEEGGSVPGWKLVPKRASRTWIDPIDAMQKLFKLGAKRPDIFTEPELKSVAQTEKALKKLGIDVPADLWHALSTGTTIASVDDPRPNVTHADVIAELQQALKAL
jgi:Protein of unknown function (DUF2800)